LLPPNGLGVSRVPPTRTPTVKTDAQLPQLAEGVGCNPPRRTRHSLTEESGAPPSLMVNLPDTFLGITPASVEASPPAETS